MSNIFAIEDFINCIFIPDNANKLRPRSLYSYYADIRDVLNNDERTANSILRSYFYYTNRIHSNNRNILADDMSTMTVSKRKEMLDDLRALTDAGLCPLVRSIEVYTSNSLNVVFEMQDLPFVSWTIHIVRTDNPNILKWTLVGFDIEFVSEIYTEGPDTLAYTNGWFKPDDDGGYILSIGTNLRYDIDLAEWSKYNFRYSSFSFTSDFRWVTDVTFIFTKDTEHVSCSITDPDFIDTNSFIIWLLLNAGSVGGELEDNTSVKLIDKLNSIRLDNASES